MMEMHSRRDSKAEGVGEHTVSVFGNEVRANARRGAARQTLQLLGRRNNSKTAI